MDGTTKLTQITKGDRMKNLTPHVITLQLPSGEKINYSTSGVVARVKTTEVVVGEFAGVPVVRREFGAIIGLPENGEPCIVSGMVLSALPRGFPGVYAPDTGVSAIRDEEGHVVAVTRLIQA